MENENRKKFHDFFSSPFCVSVTRGVLRSAELATYPASAEATSLRRLGIFVAMADLDLAAKDAVVQVAVPGNGSTASPNGNGTDAASSRADAMKEKGNKLFAGVRCRVIRLSPPKAGNLLMLPSDAAIPRSRQQAVWLGSVAFTD